AVPPLLAGTDNSRGPGVGALALVDLGLDVAGQRSGAPYRPSIGLGLLSDDLAAHQDRLPESLPGDFGRHELESSAKLLRALALPPDAHSHAGRTSRQIRVSARFRPSSSRTAWMSSSRPSCRTIMPASMPSRYRMVTRWSA